MRERKEERDKERETEKERERERERITSYLCYNDRHNNAENYFILLHCSVFSCILLYYAVILLAVHESSVV